MASAVQTYVAKYDGKVTEAEQAKRDANAKIAESAVPGLGMIIPVAQAIQDKSLGFIAGIIGFNKKDDRAGEREGGWGKESYPVKMNFPGGIVELKNWGSRQSWWNSSKDKTYYTGYELYINGQIKGEHAKYVWVQDGKLYRQNNLTPWETTQTGGEVSYYQEGGPNMGWISVGAGVEPQPKAYKPVNDKPLAPTPFVAAPGGNMFVMDGKTTPLPTTTNSQNILPYPNGGNTPLPETPTNKQTTPPSGKTEKPEDKKDNTLLYVGIGVVVVVIVVLAFIFGRK